MKRRAVVLALLVMVTVSCYAPIDVATWEKTRKARENKADKIRNDLKEFDQLVDRKLKPFANKDERLKPSIEAFKEFLSVIDKTMDASVGDSRVGETISDGGTPPYHIRDDRAEIMSKGSNFAQAKLIAFEMAEKDGYDTTSLESDMYQSAASQAHFNAKAKLLGFKKKALTDFIKTLDRVSRQKYQAFVDAGLKKKTAEIEVIAKKAERVSADLEKFMKGLILRYGLFADLDKIQEEATDFDLDAKLEMLKKKYSRVDLSHFDKKQKRAAVKQTTENFIYDCSKLYGTVIYLGQMEFEPIRKQIGEIKSPTKREEILSEYRKDLYAGLEKKVLFIRTPFIKSWQKNAKKQTSKYFKTHDKLTGYFLSILLDGLKDLCKKAKDTNREAAEKAAESAGIEMPEEEEPTPTAPSAPPKVEVVEEGPPAPREIVVEVPEGELEVAEPVEVEGAVAGEPAKVVVEPAAVEKVVEGRLELAEEREGPEIVPPVVGEEGKEEPEVVPHAEVEPKKLSEEEKQTIISNVEEEIRKFKEDMGRRRAIRDKLFEQVNLEKVETGKLDSRAALEKYLEISTNAKFIEKWMPTLQNNIDTRTNSFREKIVKIMEPLSEDDKEQLANQSEAKLKEIASNDMGYAKVQVKQQASAVRRETRGRLEALKPEWMKRELSETDKEKFKNETNEHLRKLARNASQIVKAVVEASVDADIASEKKVVSAMTKVEEIETYLLDKLPELSQNAAEKYQPKLDAFIEQTTNDLFLEEIKKKLGARYEANINSVLSMLNDQLKSALTDFIKEKFEDFKTEIESMKEGLAEAARPAEAPPKRRIEMETELPTAEEVIAKLKEIARDAKALVEGQIGEALEADIETEKEKIGRFTDKGDVDSYLEGGFGDLEEAANEKSKAMIDEFMDAYAAEAREVARSAEAGKGQEILGLLEAANKKISRLSSRFIGSKLSSLEKFAKDKRTDLPSPREL